MATERPNDNDERLNKTLYNSASARQNERKNAQSWLDHMATLNRSDRVKGGALRHVIELLDIVDALTEAPQAGGDVTVYGGGELYSDIEKVHKEWCSNGTNCVRQDCGFWTQLSTMVDYHDVSEHQQPPASTGYDEPQFVTVLKLIAAQNEILRLRASTGLEALVKACRSGVLPPWMYPHIQVAEVALNAPTTFEQRLAELRNDPEYQEISEQVRAEIAATPPTEEASGEDPSERCQFLYPGLIGDSDICDLKRSTHDDAGHDFVSGSE